MGLPLCQEGRVGLEVGHGDLRTLPKYLLQRAYESPKYQRVVWPAERQLFRVAGNHTDPQRKPRRCLNGLSFSIKPFSNSLWALRGQDRLPQELNNLQIEHGT